MKVYEQPVLTLETKKFRVRIDELSSGSYRYASWSINLEMKEEPDLILKNGEVVFGGSGGNHSYIFTNGDYKYECIINIIGTSETPPAYLALYVNDNELLFEPAQIIKK